VQGVKIEAVPAYNINKQFHPKSNGWVGFVFTLDGERIYQAGDTDLIPEMKDIKADVALLPVGGTYTMTAKEAAEAADWIKPRLAIPMHYGKNVGSLADAEEFKRLAKCETRILKPNS
jgi:L-ascorbate metabolism protein UlaG (beta-lactamase superfamily)